MKISEIMRPTERTVKLFEKYGLVNCFFEKNTSGPGGVLGFCGRKLSICSCVHILIDNNENMFPQHFKLKKD